MHAFSADTAPLPETEILGLAPGEADPVRIILAAQLRLRRCRTGHDDREADGSPGDIRQIVAARDRLLQRAVGALAGRGLERSAPAAEAPAGSLAAQNQPATG